MRILILTDNGKVANSLLTLFRLDGHQVMHQTSLAPVEAGSLDLVLLEASLTATLDPKAFGSALTLIGKPYLLLCNRSGKQFIAPEFRDLPGAHYCAQPAPAAYLLRAVARIEIERYTQSATTTLTVADLQLDVYKKTATRAGSFLKLTLKEFILLKVLMLHKNHLVLRSKLLLQLWESETAQRQNSLTQYIKYLRSKIDSGRLRPLLLTISGRGYMLKAD